MNIIHYGLDGHVTVDGELITSGQPLSGSISITLPCSGNGLFQSVELEQGSTFFVTTVHSTFRFWTHLTAYQA